MWPLYSNLVTRIIEHTESMQEQKLKQILKYTVYLIKINQLLVEYSRIDRIDVCVFFHKAWINHASFAELVVKKG